MTCNFHLKRKIPICRQRFFVEIEIHVILNGISYIYAMTTVVNNNLNDYKIKKYKYLSYSFLTFN